MDARIYSCCQNKVINVLSKQEELLLDLIEKVEDPIVKEYLNKLQNVLVKETKEDKPRVSEPPINLEKILTRFTKSKKEVTVKDLQLEIKETKFEVKTLKEEVMKLSQDLTILKIDNSFLDQKVAHQSGSSHHSDGEDDLQDLLGKGEEPANPEALEAFLKTISRINFQKWHSKVKIVISKEFEFKVVALMYLGVDLNCIR